MMMAGVVTVLAVASLNTQTTGANAAVSVPRARSAPTLRLEPPQRPNATSAVIRSAEVSRSLRDRMLIKAAHLTVAQAQQAADEAVKVEELADLELRATLDSAWLIGLASDAQFGEGWFACLDRFDGPELDTCDWTAELVLESHGEGSGSVVAVRTKVATSAHASRCRRLAACVQELWLGRATPPLGLQAGGRVAARQMGRPYLDTGTTLEQRIEFYRNELDDDDESLNNRRAALERIGADLVEEGVNIEQISARLGPELRVSTSELELSPTLIVRARALGVSAQQLALLRSYGVHEQQLRLLTAYQEHDRRLLARLSTMVQ